MRSWLVEERDFRAWQEDLRESIRRAEPLRAARLTTALNWLRTHPNDIPDPEYRFIHMSLRRHRWRTAAWWGPLVIVAGLFVFYGLTTAATPLAGTVAVTLLLVLLLGSVEGVTFWLLLRGIRPNSWRHARKSSRKQTGMRFPDFTEVTVYTSDDNGEPLRDAVVELLKVAGFEVVGQDEPVRGSWFQRLFVRGRDADASRKLGVLAEEAVRAAQLKYINAPRSESDEREANAIARLAEATRMVDEAVVCTSSILLIKSDGRLVSRVLTEAEIRTLQRNPELMRSPQELLRSLARTTGVNPTEPSQALEPGPPTPDALPPPVVSNATTGCPTCGYHPVDPQHRWQQRRDLDITWLSIDPHDQTQVIERRHCRQCQPHEPIHAVACEICGYGPLITNELAERTINGTPPEPVLSWLRTQGWHDPLDAHLICTDHDIHRDRH